MKWIKKATITNGFREPVTQTHQPIWNDGTEIPARVTELLPATLPAGAGPSFPRYLLHLAIGHEENTRIVFAGYYYSLEQMEEFLMDWAADQQ